MKNHTATNMWVCMGGWNPRCVWVDGIPGTFAISVILYLFKREGYSDRMYTIT